MCCKWGGCKGKLPSRLLLMELVSLLHEGCRSDSTKSSSYRSTEWVCSKWWRGLARESSITPHGTSFRCRSRSAGQVRRSLLSVGPLLYTCPIRSLAWLCVLSLFLVATRWISSVTLGIWRSLWSGRLLTYRGAFTIVQRSFDCNRWFNYNLVGLARPHNWTPYDQMGLRITLYRRSLLFRDSLQLRPRSQSICLNLISICLLFVRMCVCLVSRCWWSIYCKTQFTSRQHNNNINYNSISINTQLICYMFRLFLSHHQATVLMTLLLHDRWHRLCILTSIEEEGIRQESKSIRCQ